MNIFLISVLVIILLILILFIGLIIFGRKTLIRFFGTADLEKINNEREEVISGTPKSLAGMENLVLPRIEKDFPGLNISELKAELEGNIYKIYDAIETGENYDPFVSNKINELINSYLEDNSKNSIFYDNINVHRTIVEDYVKKDGIATIKFQTAYEYLKKDNNKTVKVQALARSEYIYIIDYEQVPADTKVIIINCSNCGGILKGLGNSSCPYCGSGTVDLVKKTWVFNNIVLS